jgi:FkbH-like protein
MINVALLSNSSSDQLSKILGKVSNVISPNGFDVWQQSIIDPKSVLYTSDIDVLFLLLDGGDLYEKFEDDIEGFCTRTNAILLEAIKRLPETKIFVSDLDIPSEKILSGNVIRKEKLFESLWLDMLHRITEEQKNFFVFPIKNCIENRGREFFYSSKMWYLTANRFSIMGVEELSKELLCVINAVQNPRKKCLVLDLDDTLWGGVIGEDGINGISLDNKKEGKRFYDFQKRIKEIKDTGVILAICSKNNMPDVSAAFKHPHMVLQEEDFAIIVANWEEKTNNLSKIAKELNIGLDSIVLIDDNPVERELVKSVLPMVSVPDFPIDTSKLSDFGMDIYKRYFFILQILNEDIQKSLMYKQNAQREISKQDYSNIDDYYASLDMQVFIAEADTSDISRVSQLTMKTNQFNLTTKRYTESDISRFLAVPDYSVYVGKVTDKYGDNGKTLVMILKHLDSMSVEIDTFLMSCRVMGRTIEFAVMNYMEDMLQKKGITRICATYNKTQKSAPVIDLYDQLNFTLTSISDDGTMKKYEKMLTSPLEMAKTYARVVPHES